MDVYGVSPAFLGLLQAAAAESVAHHPGCRMLHPGGNHPCGVPG